MKIATLLFLTFFAISCCKEDEMPQQKNPEPNKTSVYVTGSEYKNNINVAILWIDGVKKYLTDGAKTSFAFDIAFSGTDRYVVGSERETNSIGTAKLWRNNESISLSDGTKNTIANGIAIKGNDVYVIGQEYNGLKKTIKIWKNGVATDLSDGTTDAEVNKIVVAGDDIWVLGMDNNPITNKRTIYVWKNNFKIPITDGSKNCTASDMVISGNDVYITGYELFAGIYANKIWKNGTSTELDPGSTGILPLPVANNGTDVYVTGLFENATASGTITKLWKNNVEIACPVGNSKPITDINFFENDRYILAQENFNGNQKAFYYRNEEKIYLNEIGVCTPVSIYIKSN
jgi:hypothetical protein